MQILKIIKNQKELLNLNPRPIDDELITKIEEKKGRIEEGQIHQGEGLGRRQKWTKQQYKEVIWAYEYAKKMHSVRLTVGSYEIWRHRNPDIFPEMSPKKLSNQRRFILRENKLADNELKEIEKNIDFTMEHHIKPADAHIIETNLTTQVAQSDVESVSNQLTLENQKQETDEVEMVMCKIQQKISEIKNIKLEERNNLNKIVNIGRCSYELELVNKALQKMIIETNLDLTTINHMIYAGASIIAGEKKQEQIHQYQLNVPSWKKRIQQTINKYRKEIALVKEFKKGNPSQKVRKEVLAICDQSTMSLGRLDELCVTLTMKLQAKAQRLRRYNKRHNQYCQNKQFCSDMKIFYRNLKEQQIKIKNPPSINEIDSFWRKILENEVNHRHEVTWIAEIKRAFKHLEADQWRDFTVEEITTAIKQTSNWKSPGPDKVHNFWIKKLTVLHPMLTSAYNKLIRNTTLLPDWFLTGVTFMIPKGSDTKEPGNYRPITCLPTLFKILTSVITNRVYEYLLRNKILPPEQKGCIKSTRGCKDQLLLNMAITQSAKKEKKNLSMAWIDYRKAFDSVPHSWIIEVMEIFKVCPSINKFVADSMLRWRTKLCLYYEGGALITDSIIIKRGIFQGDSLSPLLFCMALFPLTHLLNQQRLGYVVHNQCISHLLYMDDLKLFMMNEVELKQALTIVKTFSSDIKMIFGLDKCAVVNIKKGVVMRGGGMDVDQNTHIKSLEVEETYKYLGMEEAEGIMQVKMKNRVKKEYFDRVKNILRTQLNAKNKITAINGFAIPVISYSYGIVEWLRSELQQIDRRTRKLLTMGGAHHPSADVDRLYFGRTDGGRGLIGVEDSFEKAIVDLNEYIQAGRDRFVEVIQKADKLKKKYSISKETEKISNCYKPDDPEMMQKQELYQLIHNKHKDNYQNKMLHGRFINEINKPGLDLEGTWAWLKGAGLKIETESLIVAAQDQALNTKYFQKKILKQQIDGLCRMCHKHVESISHIVSGCTILAPVEYTKRHNRVASYIHWKICKYFNMETATKYYEHCPQSVKNFMDGFVLWDQTIYTDRMILANRPDIVIQNRKDKTCLLIDVSIPDDVNVIQKEAEKKNIKISKLKYRECGIQRLK